MKPSRRARAWWVCASGSNAPFSTDGFSLLQEPVYNSHSTTAQVLVRDQNPSPPTTSPHKALTLLTATRLQPFYNIPKEQGQKAATTERRLLAWAEFLRQPLLASSHTPFHHRGESSFPWDAQDGSQLPHLPLNPPADLTWTLKHKYPEISVSSRGNTASRPLSLTSAVKTQLGNKLENSFNNLLP